MNSVRLITAILLVTLCLMSCGKESEELPPLSSSTVGDICEEYGITDYRNIDLLGCYGANFSGLRDGRLWLASFNPEDKTLIINWTDNKTFNKKRKIYKGYGEYEDVIIQRISMPNIVSFEKDFASSITYHYGDGAHESFNVLLFKQGTITREIMVVYPGLQQWYDKSVVNDNCCYSLNGDTIFVAKEDFYIIGSESTDVISYKEVIYTDFIDGNFSIGRMNVEIREDVWKGGILGLSNEPSDAKMVVTITDKSANIWSYSVDVTYYDGSKKTVKFKVNIDDGTIEE